MMRALDHVSFTVSNRDRAVDFYRTLLGVEPLGVGSESGERAGMVMGYVPIEVKVAFFPLPDSQTVLELFEYVTPPGEQQPLATNLVGNGHIGLLVDDLDAEYVRLQAAGATFTYHEPVEVLEGPWKGTKAIYMRDPDGITIELLQSVPAREVRFGDTD